MSRFEFASFYVLYRQVEVGIADMPAIGQLVDEVGVIKCFSIPGGNVNIDNMSASPGLPHMSQVTL